MKSHPSDVGEKIHYFIYIFYKIQSLRKSRQTSRKVDILVTRQNPNFHSFFDFAGVPQVHTRLRHNFRENHPPNVWGFPLIMHFQFLHVGTIEERNRNWVILYESTQWRCFYGAHERTQ